MKAGDVVFLKSGSPTMTVERANVGDDFANQEVVCVWFVNNFPQKETFHPSCLEGFPEDPPEKAILPRYCASPDGDPAKPLTTDRCDNKDCFCKK